MERKNKAFTMVLRPNDEDKKSFCLKNNKIALGWCIDNLNYNNKPDYYELREKIKEKFYNSHANYRSAGQAASMVNEFCYITKKDNYIIVPEYRYQFYLGIILEDEFYIEDDTYWKNVKWVFGLNNPKIWKNAPAILSKACRTYKSIKDSSYAIDEIDKLIENPESLNKSWDSEIYNTLCENLVTSLTKGRINPTTFQHEILPVVLSAMGANDNIEQRAGKSDKGIDIIVTFNVAEISEKMIGIQAKNFMPNPPLKEWVIDQTLNGAREEGLSEAWIITTGTISDDVNRYLEEINSNEENIIIRIIDGYELSKLILKHINKIYIEEPEDLEIE